MLYVLFEIKPLEHGMDYSAKGIIANRIWFTDDFSVPGWLFMICLDSEYPTFLASNIALFWESDPIIFTKI